MVHLIRFRLSLKFWIAESDISRDIFCATEITTAPKIQNTSIIGTSREIRLLFFVSFCFFFISSPHFTHLDVLRTFITWKMSNYTTTILLYHFLNFCVKCRSGLSAFTPFAPSANGGWCPRNVLSDGDRDNWCSPCFRWGDTQIDRRTPAPADREGSSRTGSWSSPGLHRDDRESIHMPGAKNRNIVCPRRKHLRFLLWITTV